MKLIRIFTGSKKTEDVPDIERFKPGGNHGDMEENGVRIHCLLVERLWVIVVGETQIGIPFEEMRVFGDFNPPEGTSLEHARDIAILLSSLRDKPAPRSPNHWTNRPPQS